MSAQAAELPKLWDNPVFVRFRRSRLRLRKAVFWYLLTLILTTFVVMLGYILRANAGIPERDAARAMWLPVLVIQGLILMLKGTGAVSAALIQDRLDQTLDYQRLTPMSPLRNLIGYLFGLPVLEYTMVALTLPHLAFVVIVGQIPLITVGAVYLSFLICVVLYHITAISAGMAMRRWILGYLVAVLAVAFVNVVLPLVVSQFGLKFLQYLSVWPVIGQMVLPLLTSAAETGVVTGNPFLRMADAVPFYGWSLSPFVFTLVLQGALIVTFATIALRRWKSTGRHPLGKPYALSFLTGFIVLTIGNVWPAITRDYMPFAIFGVTDVDELRAAVAIGLPLVYCLIVWALCFVLLASVTPTHHAYLRGLRRAGKLNRSGPNPWEDDASNLPFAAALAAAALSGLGVLLYTASAHGFLEFLDAAGFSYWHLPIIFGLLLLYSALLLQAVELKPAVILIQLIWLLPILVAILFGASMRSAETMHAVIASVSPLALLLMGGLLPLEYLAMDEPADPMGAFFSTGINSGLAFLSVQIGWLGWRWRRMSAEYRGLALLRGGEPPAASHRPSH